MGILWEQLYLEIILEQRKVLSTYQAIILLIEAHLPYDYLVSMHSYALQIGRQVKVLDQSLKLCQSLGVVAAIGVAFLLIGKHELGHTTLKIH